MLNTENIQSLIDSGEGYNVEFKVRVPSKVRELTEEICAFANADGGYLLIGIDDNGQIIGTSLENEQRSAIQGSISEISPALHCELYAINIEDKTVWVIDVSSGKDKPYIFSGSIFVREERILKNFVLSKKCVVSFKNAIKSSLMQSLARGLIYTRMQTNKR